MKTSKLPSSKENHDNILNQYLAGVYTEYNNLYKFLTLPEDDTISLTRVESNENYRLTIRQMHHLIIEHLENAYTTMAMCSTLSNHRNEFTESEYYSFLELGKYASNITKSDNYQRMY